MSARNGLLTCVVGLGVALLPGCTSTAPAWIDPHDQIPDLPKFAVGPTSPYHVQGPVVTKPADEPRPPKKEETPTILPPLPPQPPPPAKPAPPVQVIPVAQSQESKKTAPPEEPLVMALRAYLQKRSPEALEALARYQKANQDMLLVALPFAARLTEGDIDKVEPREAAELADMIQGAVDHLRQRAALRVEKMLFCRKIDDFGEFVARETVNGVATFEAGTGDQPGEPIQVYVELRNVSSKQRGELFETRLAGSIELLDFEGRSAYRKIFAPELHRGRSARHDFFVNCSFSVPRRIPPGRYTLRVEVRDITDLPANASLEEAPPAHRIVSQRLDLQVVEPRPNRAPTASR
jgi:hypothetical protein